MISISIEQYITRQSETSLPDFILKKVELECPDNARLDVLGKLYDNGWEVTRSGPITDDFSKQYIVATKEVKIGK